MFEVTESATRQITEYFQDKTVAPIRIFLNEGGCGGPGLVMALDEKKATDDEFVIGGFTYLVDRDFLETVKPIRVDFTESGYRLDCAVQFSSGCSGCGSTGSCCSH
jgi:Fe-S cluster assembly iron-binding protein IscA